MCHLTNSKNSGSWRCDTYLAKPQEISLDHKISEEDQVGEAKMLANYLTKGSAPGKQLTTITGACMLDVERRDMLRRTAQAKRVEQYEQRGEQPRQARTYIWEDGEDKTGPTASYLLTARPLPCPRAEALNDEVWTRTICDCPNLFKICCQINIKQFQKLLTHHLNWPFVESVIVGLQEGLWPSTDSMKDGYLKSWDGSCWLLETEKEHLFLKEQVDMEINAGHFLALFRMELLLGMYSLPVHMVLKPESEMMQLIVGHSMITHKGITGIQLDGLHSLRVLLMQIKLRHSSTDLDLFKSDVSACTLFTRSSKSLLWYIDRKNNFSNCTSQIIWRSFMLLVVWILVFRCGLGVLKCYIGDAFLVATALYVSWYEPYQRHMPTNQCKVLWLQDEIHLLHTEKKQILGHIIPILGFEVDENLLMTYLSKEKQEKLVNLYTGVHK